jgi:hypothetical protein
VGWLIHVAVGLALYVEQPGPGGERWPVSSRI